MKYFYTLIFSILSVSSIAQNASWTAVLPALFPTNVSGQIHGISRCTQMKFHHSNPNKMYAVSARGGLFISTNGGNNWSVAPGTDFMTTARLSSVCVDYNNDNILYLGTGDHNYYYSGIGIMKSTDGGNTFIPSGLSGLLVLEIIMDPLNSNVLVAATNSGIYKTTNGGSTWTLKTSARPFDDLKQKTPVSRTMYAATTDSAFFRSTDFGDTWTQITSGIVLPTGTTNGNGCRIATTPADSNIVYLGMVVNGGTLYKSTDGGTTFTAMKNTISPYLTYYSNSSTSSGQGDYNFSIGVDRIDPSIVYLVSHNIWKSTNSGSTWTQLTNWWEKCHTDMHQIITSPYDNNKLYNVNDGGIFLSTDGGNNWTPKSDGMYGYEIYHGKCSPTRKDMFSIGTQDNGELYATSSGWFTNRGGDWGSRCAFDYRPNSSMVYYLENNKRRLVTGGDATYGLPVTTLEGIAFHRSNANLGFAAKNDVYRTTNLLAATPTWTQISSFSKPIMAIHSSYADPNKLYVITNDGMIYVCNDAQSATPTFTGYTLPNSTNNAASITSIKSNSNVIYISANTQVFKSINNGATWTNIKYNLPSVNHVDITADEFFSSNELVFIASGNAVYYKTGNATSWTLYSSQLPTRTNIVDLSIFNDSTSNTSLRVATYGRGMWETPINNLRALAANFSVSNNNPCPGQSVTFSDLSTGTVSSRTWSFPGGTPSTSTLENPTVTYNNSGVYNVSLIVANSTNSDTAIQTSFVSTVGGNIPVTESFEGNDDPPLGWKNIDNGNNGYQWQKTTSAGGFGNSVSSMVFDNYSWNISGQKDELQVKRLNLSGYNSAYLTFDVAYQTYTGYVDSLNVLLSTNCGNTFTTIYAKGGSNLASAGTGTNNFVPTANQWRKDSINLNAYIGNSDVIISFQNVNGYGNKLYIDNINLNATVAANAGVDQSICSGSAAVAIGMNPVNGINYSWSPTTGLSNPNISNPMASPTSTTSYILTATHQLSGISRSDTVVVTVNPKPTLNAGNDLTICAGSTVTLNAISNGTVTWNNGITNNQQFLPLVSGVYIATATNNFNCSNKDTVIITVNPKPTINAGNDTSVCAGSTIILNATSNASLIWSNGLVNNQAFIPNATTQYIATSTNSYECSASDTIIVTVNPLPTLNAGNDLSICNGLQISLNATSNGTVTWNNGVTNNQPFSPTSGMYIATATNSAGCQRTDTVMISVGTNPNVSAGTNKSICPGGSTQLTASGGTSYIWNTGDTSSTITVNQAGAYYVVASNNTGCSDTSSPVIVTEKPMPSSIKIKINGLSTVCEPNIVNFDIDLPTSAISGFSYQWYLNGSPISGATDSNYSASTTGSYNLYVSGGPNCFKFSGAKSATIKPLPTATFTNNGPTTICAGQSVTLTAPTITGYTYTWLKDGLSVGSGNTKLFKVAGNYTVVAKLNGCNDTANNSIQINVNPLPIAGISAVNNATFCIGDSCTLAATPSGFGFSYNWQNSGASAITSSPYYVTYTAGTCKVMITDNNNCTSKLSSTSVKTKVNPIPIATITPLGSTTIAANGNVKLNASPTSGVNWQWYKDGQIIIGATMKQYIATSGGNYTVLVVKSGCINISAPIIVTQTTVKETLGIIQSNESSEFEFAVYPNPTKDLINVEIRGLEEINANIHLIDMNGKLIQLKRITTHTSTFDLSQQSSGIYFLRYKDDKNRTGTIKVIKE